MHKIHEAVIHKLDKERQQKKATVVTRDRPLQVAAPVEKLVGNIYDLYASRTGRGFGRFEEDETVYPTAKILRAVFRSKRTAFFDASKQLMNILAQRAEQASLSTGGYVLMAHMTSASGTHWFIVAIITNSDGSTIDDKSLEVMDSAHVDLHDLRVAGRVNLDEWLDALTSEDARYLGFLKQGGVVSDYFQQFLGCNEIVVSAEETKKLSTVLKAFAKDQKMTAAKEEDFLKAAYDYCVARHKDDEPLNLESLSHAVWPKSPTRLQKAFNDADVAVSDGFVPDKRALKSLVKIRAKTEHWTLELDRQAIAKGQIKYDPRKRTVTIKGLPAELEAELRSETSNG